MKENKKNEELQSRRDFFKKAAKTALPILGAVVLSSVPAVANSLNHEASQTGDCSYGCSSSCSMICRDSCYNGCKGTCDGLCSGACKGSCQENCSRYCANSCSSGCHHGSKY